MRIHGIARRRLGTDGHGVTDLVAMAGCPLGCEYCLNKRVLAESDAYEVSAGELLEDVMQEACYFVATDGGVAFGGGEPLLQWRGIREFAEMRPEWMRLTIETSLHVPYEAVLELVPFVDMWLIDIKTLSPAIYAPYAHGSLELPLGNLRRLLVGHADKVRIRVPVIPGYKNQDTAEWEAKALQVVGARDIEVFDYVIRN